MFRHAYFEYHAHVRLRFKLASGLGEPWTRDGGVPPGCPLSMMFIVALYLPWCMLTILSASREILLCMFVLLGSLLGTQGWLAGSLHLISAFLEGDRWTVKLDVRDLDTTFRGWSATLASRVQLVISRLVLIFVFPRDFHGILRVIRSMFIPGALRGIEASFLVMSSLRNWRSSNFKVVWSCRQPLANVGAVLSLLEGPEKCDPGHCVVWFWFHMARRYLAYRPTEVGRVYRVLDMVREGCPGHGPVHLLVASATEMGFQWDPHMLGWVRPGLQVLSKVCDS